jgi:hypothetical protein
MEELENLAYVWSEYFKLNQTFCLLFVLHGVHRIKFLYKFQFANRIIDLSECCFCNQ